jgi:hypothetical protein
MGLDAIHLMPVKPLLTIGLEPYHARQRDRHGVAT